MVAGDAAGAADAVMGLLHLVQALAPAVFSKPQTEHFIVPLPQNLNISQTILHVDKDNVNKYKVYTYKGCSLLIMCHALETKRDKGIPVSGENTLS